MAKAKSEARPEGSSTTERRRPRAKNPEARLNQLAAYAIDLLEQRLIDGTASSQEVTQLLKYASPKYKLETELLKKQTELATAKTEQLQSQKRMDELYADAIKAMNSYRGQDEPDE